MSSLAIASSGAAAVAAAGGFVRPAGSESGTPDPARAEGERPRRSSAEVRGLAADGNVKSETTEAVERERGAQSGLPQTRLSIIFHEDSRLFIARSVDFETGEVVDQFPPEQTVRRIAAFIEEVRAKERARQVDVTA